MAERRTWLAMSEAFGLVGEGRTWLAMSEAFGLVGEGRTWLAMSEAFGFMAEGRVEWRRRESNPRPKGLSLQNSTCVAVLDMSRAATKNGECAARQPESSRPAVPGSRRDQPAKWRSFPSRRLPETNVADLVRPRAQAACSQLRCFAHRFYERDEQARHASHSPLPPSKPIAPTRRTAALILTHPRRRRGTVGLSHLSGAR